MLDRHSCWNWWVTFFIVSLWVPQVIVGQSDRTTIDTNLKRYEFLQIRMGIPVAVTLYAPSDALANQASQRAYEKLREIDRIMSDYDPHSELMQLCQTAQPGKPVPISQDLFTVLEASQQLSEESEGAFDVTIGPVGKLWRLARRKKQLPDANRLAEARQRVGYQSLKLDYEHRTVTLLKSGMQLDLGSIAKGYAADQALEVVRKLGVTRVLVDAGGDVVAGDPPPGRDHWTVELEDRTAPLGAASRTQILNIANCAVATSGDTYQYLEVDGVRYSHLLDPTTGVGTTTPSSVTVIAPTGMLADGLAIVVSILHDPSRIENICRTHEVEYLKVLLENDGTPTTTESKNFRNKFVQAEDTPRED